MGKTKYIDEETMGQRQATYTIHRPTKGRQSVQEFGRFSHQTDAEPSLRMMFGQIKVRLRRTWVSLRYQFHRVTFGMLQNNGVYKLGTLAFAGYLLLAPNDAPASFLKNPLGVFANNTKYNELPIEPIREESTLEIGGGGAAAKPIKQKGNDAAPVGVEGVQEDIAQKYVARFGSIARTEMEKFGIPASISLAQGLVESRAGTSTLARRNNNHFGMKCFSKKCAKGHCSNFSDDHHKDFFRVYGNAWESWRAHSEMLATGRYASLKKYGSDYRSWAYGLKALGYATDRNYADKLIGMIERYDLHRYDK